MEFASMIVQPRPAKGLWIAALLVALAVPSAAQKVPVDPNAVRNQLNQPANQQSHSTPVAATPSPAQSAAKPSKAATPAQPQPAKPVAAQAAKPVAPATKPAAATSSAAHAPAPAEKPAAKAPATETAKAAATSAPTAAPAAASSAAKRDPFDPLVGKDKESAGSLSADRLPPGKAGLVITTLRVDGVVQGPGGMVAIVSNPQQRVYFVHEGDQLFDGRVGKITMEAVAFHQMGKDPFGAPVERDVTKQLYPTPGEQP